MITPLEAAIEAHWIGLGIHREREQAGHGFGFMTTAAGLVVSVSRANRDQLLAAVERAAGGEPT